MSVKVAINGFGRIGRCAMRAIIVNKLPVDVVAINDLTDPATLAHLLKYDSIHRELDAEISHEKDAIIVNGKRIIITSERDPQNLPWGKLGIDVVLESTGIFTKRDQAAKHLAAGAKKVIISAPSSDADLMVVLGVNFDMYDKDKHHVISNASCTTNCLAPIVKIIHNEFGIEYGQMTTIHSYTNDQKILDLPHSDIRRARAAALSMIPTSTGAAKAVGTVIPELKGKLDGLAIRVPTSNVSIVDFTCELIKKATKEEINAAIKKAAEGPLKGIVQYTDLELVSIDYNDNPHSAIFDSKLTLVVGGSLKIFAWYDNEWGYSNRVTELMTKLI